MPMASMKFQELREQADLNRSRGCALPQILAEA